MPAIIWEKSAAQASIVLPKLSPYAMFINHVITKLRENGQLGMLLDGVQYHQPFCGDILRTGQSLSISKLASAFVLVAIGSGIAFVILIVEKIFYPPQNQVQKHRYKDRVIRNFFAEAHGFVQNRTNVDRKTVDMFILKLQDLRNRL